VRSASAPTNVVSTPVSVAATTFVASGRSLPPSPQPLTNVASRSHTDLKTTLVPPGRFAPIRNQPLLTFGLRAVALAAELVGDVGQALAELIEAGADHAQLAAALVEVGGRGDERLIDPLLVVEVAREQPS
jgi:hypothetical protein